jgi:hypothetical protein
MNNLARLPRQTLAPKLTIHFNCDIFAPVFSKHKEATMCRMKAQALVLNTDIREPERLYRHIAACFDGQTLVELLVVVRYTRQKQPLFADNKLRGQLVSLQKEDNCTVRLGAKIYNAATELGLTKGEFDFIMDLRTGVCDVPDRMRTRDSCPAPAAVKREIKPAGKKQPDSCTCVCLRLGSLRGVNKERGPWRGSEVYACAACETWWSRKVCSACKRAFDDRVKHSICEQCNKPICPACGSCDCVEPLPLLIPAFSC